MFARAVPKFDMITKVLRKEFSKFLGYCSRMNLVWVNREVKDLPCSTKEVSDDYYIIGIRAGDCLIYAASDSK